jgi:uncharacterized membrane protein YfbV (UPF0208 family)
MATRAFGFLFAAFLASLLIASFRWLGHVWTLGRKIAMAEFILGMAISGLFLLTAKSVTPEHNQKRLWTFMWAILIIQVFVEALQG